MVTGTDFHQMCRTYADLNSVSAMLHILYIIQNASSGIDVLYAYGLLRVSGVASWGSLAVHSAIECSWTTLLIVASSSQLQFVYIG